MGEIKLEDDLLWPQDGVDRLVLNGAFAVAKPGDAKVELQRKTMEACRVMMNWIPSNSCQLTIDGDTSELHSASQWSGLLLSPHENLVLSSGDRKLFVYVFKMPDQRARCIPFSTSVPGHVMGRPDVTACFVAS